MAGVLVVLSFANPAQAAPSTAASTAPDVPSAVTSAQAPLHDPNAYSVTVYAQKLGDAGPLHREQNKYYFLPLPGESVPDFCSNIHESLPYDSYYMALTKDSSDCVLFDDNAKPSEEQLKEMGQGIFTDVSGQKWRLEVPDLPNLFDEHSDDK